MHKGARKTVWGSGLGNMPYSLSFFFSFSLSLSLSLPLFYRIILGHWFFRKCETQIHPLIFLSMPISPLPFYLHFMQAHSSGVVQVL